MVTPIRPSLTPPTGQPGASSAGGAARTAAQRAFFDAALGRATPAAPTTAQPAPAAPSRPAAPAAPAAQTRPVVQAAAMPPPDPAEPVRYRRPGSILDIKV